MRIKLRRAVGLVPVLVLALVGFAAGCGAGDDAAEAEGAQEGAVTIATEIDFSSEPFSGAFEVAEGSQVLGCSSGSFVDTEVSDGSHKVFSCEEGENEGTFTAFFTPPASGPWRIVDATGDFTGLTGSGDFSVEQDEDEKSGVETFAGEMGYE